ncbi:30S ribosomal protein S6 [Candidatus Cytomitobacter primus]|uniref:Small ribosomal subunit protein bS6 n=1 Tax=Candidatus Cytomitobacter primus TaxID=2066024 RepID=A0A5C0UF57_9PROT|nr:30S ribosomal protein S6 [Candidatus Cytomitobacter primus]QEK38409.1 30S ribosomal protein S6 [Candidatus Cytomitobacter primus]
MRSYRLVCVLQQILSAEEAQLQVDKITNHLTENNGEIIGVKNFGLMKLAYQMNRNARGHYFIIDFKLDPLKVKSLRSLMSLNDKFLRDIIVILDKESKTLDKISFAADKNRERKLDLIIGESAFLNNLGQFISTYGKILSRHIIGISSKQMRCLSQAIKRARYIGLLPFRIQ